MIQLSTRVNSSLKQSFELKFDAKQIIRGYCTVLNEEKRFNRKSILKIYTVFIIIGKRLHVNDKTINMDLIYDDFTLTKLAIFAPPPFHNYYFYAHTAFW